MMHNKNIISLASSLGQLLTGWRFAQYSQQVIAPYVKRYVYMKLFALIIIFFSLNAGACELTPEYKKLRSDVFKEIHASYKSCKEATKSYFFYKSVAKCMSEGKGKNIGGGCFHVVGYEKTHDESALQHCEIMKPTTEQFMEYLAVKAKEKGVQKCIS